MPKKKGKVPIINLDYLTSTYQRAMLSGLVMASELGYKKDLKVLHLGTGAGTLPMFLYNNLKESLDKITTVDINPSIVEIGKKYFGFQTNKKLEHITEDAYEYVKNQMQH